MLRTALLAVLLPALAHAGDGFDVRSWLDPAGVKLVAVEFYSLDCKPCMEAVPKWKALHDKYRAQGMRLVVIKVASDSRCVSRSARVYRGGALVP